MKLFDFAYFPREWEFLDLIAENAVDEYWGPELKYLRTYCETNFEVAYSQNLIYYHPEPSFALWRVGHLVTRNGAPFYMYFAKNYREEQEPWFFVAVLWGRRATLNIRWTDPKTGLNKDILIAEPPREPRYEAPVYHGDYILEFNDPHCRQRMRDVLPEVENERVLQLVTFGAVEHSHRLHTITAVPQYFQGHYQYLLPLYVSHEDHVRRPDLVAALDEEPSRQTYIVRTLLPPDWAYPYARSIATDCARLRPWIEKW